MDNEQQPVTRADLDRAIEAITRTTAAQITDLRGEILRSFEAVEERIRGTDGDIESLPARPVRKPDPRRRPGNAPERR